MKGVVLTSTGETLTTPVPTQLANLFVATPKVGFNFEKIFDESYEEEDTPRAEEPIHDDETSEVPSDTPNPPPTPSKPERKASLSSATKLTRSNSVVTLKSTGSSSSSMSRATSSRTATVRTRRTSLIPTPPTRTGLTRTTSAGPAVHQRSSSEQLIPSSSRAPGSSTGTLTRTKSSQITILPTSPVQWDLQDEENLPSPFLKKAEKERQRAATFSHLKEQSHRKAKPTAGPGPVPKRRPSEQNILRAYAAANAIKGGS
jgi:NIMA (never in mitosis gene a)-related kinase